MITRELETTKYCMIWDEYGNHYTSSVVSFKSMKCKIPCYDIDVFVWINLLEVWCYGRESSSCPTSGTRHVIYSRKHFVANIQLLRKYELIIFVWKFSSCLYCSLIFTLKYGTGSSLWLNVFILQIFELKRWIRTEQILNEPQVWSHYFLFFVPG